MLTNLGYESTVPQRSEEMLVAVVSQNIKVIIDAYILVRRMAGRRRKRMHAIWTSAALLARSPRQSQCRQRGAQGTLFHFLVKRDPELEAAREFAASLDEYCSQRRLPKELTDKMQTYLQFQQQHASAVSDHVLKARSSAPRWPSAVFARGRRIA